MTKDKKLPRGVFRRHGKFYIRFNDQYGQEQREAVGPFLQQALAAYQKRKSEVREGKFFPEKIKARAVLFSEISKDYLKLVKARKRSWRDDEDHLETLKALNGIPVAELTPAHLEAVISDLAEERQ